MKHRHLFKLHNSFPILKESLDVPLQRQYGFYFTNENKYAIEGENQYDWNKLCGLKGRFLTPMYDTIMIGWRWNPILDCFETIPYFHLGGPEHKFDDRLIVRFNPNEQGLAKVEIKDNTNVLVNLCNTDTQQKVVDDRWFSERYSKFWEIAPWFGGQSACPKLKMTLNIDRF